MSKKLKILMLCDHPLSTSGVGTQSRWLISGLLSTGKYSFRVLGGAMKHSDYNVVTVNPDFIIKPVDGFGTKEMLRQHLAIEKPDAVFLFTDPRFFLWVWEMEDEVHQFCPIVYWHLWDNPPWPEFNRVLYESTDLINCINWPTYDMLKTNMPDRPSGSLNYVPHGVPQELFKKMPVEETLRHKAALLGNDRIDHFVALYVSRNARRKVPSDILYSWKMFLDQLQELHGHRKATMLMHTDPNDQEGPNLGTVVKMLGLENNVKFSNSRINFEQISTVYNVSDVVINRSLNEGFGLSVLEAKMCEKPVIALKTGGITRQVQDHETGKEYGVALEPEVRNLVGNQIVPYIFEDNVSHETVAKAFMKVYLMSPEERALIGKESREHALKNFNINDVIKQWDETLSKTIGSFDVHSHKRWESITI